MRQGSRRGWVVGLVAAILAVIIGMGIWSRRTEASDIRKVYEIGNRVGFFSDTSVGIDTSAENVDFVAAGFVSSPGYVQRVRIFNDDATKNLLFKMIPYGTSLPTGALTTPANATATEVVDLKPGDDGAVGFELVGKFRGMRWQSKETALAARVVIEY